MVNVLNSRELSYCSTQELKNELLQLVKDRDADALKTKILFYQDELLPYIEELSKRNPYPAVEDQIPIVLGVWTPLWSTIPFHDVLHGRIHSSSYQIFHADGLYANIARYAPGYQSSLLKQVSAKLPAYDLMVMQKYEVKNNQWYIRNVGVFQAFRNRDIPLTIDDADEWFTNVVNTKVKDKHKNEELPQTLELVNLDRSTVRKLEKTYLATPALEHLYVDRDLRIVKTQREQNQRHSYTIAIRRR